jgi:hypothetical protein
MPKTSTIISKVGVPPLLILYFCIFQPTPLLSSALVNDKGFKFVINEQ